MPSRELRPGALAAQDDSPLPGLSVDQVGIVVRDLNRAMELYSSLFRTVGRWQGWTYGPKLMTSSTFRGQPGVFSMRLALAGSSPQIELIEPLAGPSIYHEWLRERGEGLHHLGCRVRSLEDGVANLKAAGYEMLQSGVGYGRDGDGGFAYFDTVVDFGVLLEVIEVPKRRLEPEFAWPTRA